MLSLIRAYIGLNLYGMTPSEEYNGRVHMGNFLIGI